eukprot:10827777-Ditylum_brightwellii.AAC.1
MTAEMLDFDFDFDECIAMPALVTDDESSWSTSDSEKDDSSIFGQAQGVGNTPPTKQATTHEIHPNVVEDENIHKFVDANLPQLQVEEEDSDLHAVDDCAELL